MEIGERTYTPRADFNYAIGILLVVHAIRDERSSVTGHASFKYVVPFSFWNNIDMTH